MTDIPQKICKAYTRKKLPCKNYAMINSDYCYMHSFGKIKGTPWYKNSMIHLIITVVLAITLFKIGPTRKNQDTILQNLYEVANHDEGAHQSTDVALRFVYPKSPALILVNQSTVIARYIKWAVQLWNMDLPDRNDPLPIPVSTFDFIKPHKPHNESGL